MIKVKVKKGNKLVCIPALLKKIEAKWLKRTNERRYASMG